ncbi:hypothetical protein USDA257_c05840 [Sinorhizobium fredii USDA 257]|uniref:Uncharacterized protein n=1 Tax=Sinorhizobium fredii (strain USDA 257) TaxID=1185652 RepID=I3WZX3_SINF2|nr:hypothetical protein USDA257_c05840 [Sinorhizobium fredii USDA 257]
MPYAIAPIRLPAATCYGRFAPRLVSGLWSRPRRTSPAPSRTTCPVALCRGFHSTTVAGAAPGFDRLPNSPPPLRGGTLSIPI